MSPTAGPGSAPGANLGLRTAVFGGLTLTVLAMMGTLATGWSVREFAREKEEEQERLRESALLAALRLEAVLQRHRQMVVLAAGLIDELQGATAPQLEAVMRQVQQVNAGLFTALATDGVGKVLATSPSWTQEGRSLAQVIGDVSDREYFRQPAASGRPFVSDVFRGRGFGAEPIVAISAPWRDVEGRFGGVIEASLNLARLAEFGESGDLVRFGQIVIIDGAGRVVHSGDPDRFPTLAEFPAQLAGGEGRGAWQDSLADSEGRPGYDAIGAWHAVRVEGMARDWKVLMVQDWSAMRWVIIKNLALICAGFGVVLGGAALAAGIVIARVLRPVQGLTHLARMVARDPLGPVPALERSGLRELQELQEDVVAMSEGQREALEASRRALAEKEAVAQQLRASKHALEESQLQLEKRVAERTAQLSEVVGHLETEVAARRRSEQLLELKSRTLELMAGGAPLDRVLESVLEEIGEALPDACGAISLVDPAAQRFETRATVRMPPGLLGELNGSEVREGIWPCADAAVRRQRVVATDVADFAPEAREVAQRHGVEACWSTPILSERGEALGVLGVFHRRPLAPDGENLRVLDLGAQMAALAVSRERSARQMERVEEHLRQAQKLEALGTLAGGVAHGFNNLLVPMLGHAELLLKNPVARGVIGVQLQEIVTACQRARGMVQQMLAFSRHESPHRQPMRLAPVVREVLSLLSVSTRREIRLVMPPEVDPWVMGDSSQLHQLLMNLAHNAVQATDGAGGEVEVELGERLVASEETHLAGRLMPGRYAWLQVRDRGPGIAAEMRAKLFDPFFTTRSAGQGMGLGLPVVHGIVMGHQGAIDVESAVGTGTTVRVHLPAADSPEPAPTAAPVTPPGGNRRVLLVDDETQVLELTAMLLESHDYQVTSCESAEEALKRLSADPGAYDLLMSDVTMPGMSGVALAEAAAAVRGDLPILLLTGYGRLEAGSLKQLRNPHRVLGKPFDIEQLLAVARDLMAAARPG